MKATYFKKEPQSFVNGKWTFETTEIPVRVLAQAENYAMVRRRGCVPFVVRASELRIEPKLRRAEHMGSKS